MEKLPRAFVQQMERELGPDAPAFFSTYNEESSVGLRVSSRKGWKPDADFESVPWCRTGYYVPNGLRMGKEPLHAAGAYYLQEPSAMAPVEALGVQPGMRVLDLCAAPGGKSTQIADHLAGKGVLVTNEIHPARARILLENIERMGVINAVVLNEKPARIAAAFGAWFDAVLVDAPCSGEGMFRRDPDAISQWSEDAPQMCHERQLEILESAARCLKGGGTMVYSTCTYNHIENEETIAAFLKTHPDFEVDDSLSLPGVPCRGGMAHLYPHQLHGEGHFLARLRKKGTEESFLEPMEGEKLDVRCGKFLSEVMPEYAVRKSFVQGEWIYALPEEMPQMTGLRILRAGVQIGRLASGRMEPAHALALAAESAQVKNRVDVSREDALKFLRGETLPGDFSGWGLVSYEGLALGWGKGSNGQIKNHVPKGLRWKN